jgi:hypothetical protein
MRRVWIALLAPLLLASTGLAASNYAPESLDRYFRLDWQTAPGASGTALSGYIYNKTSLSADRMRLRIDQVDAAGKVVGSTTTWVLGGVPSENRAWFETRVPPAASYRVEVVSFDWLGRGGGGN